MEPFHGIHEMTFPLPSGKQHSYGKSPFGIGKSTISMKHFQ